MFFFFVGEVTQQVRHVINPGAGRCIVCNSRADLVKYEKVLKLFFVPVWRWLGKDPLMHCNNCGIFFPPQFSLPPPQGEAVGWPMRCGNCSREVDLEFRFCPFCGSEL